MRKYCWYLVTRSRCVYFLWVCVCMYMCLSVYVCVCDLFNIDDSTLWWYKHEFSFRPRLFSVNEIENLSPRVTDKTENLWAWVFTCLSAISYTVLHFLLTNILFYTSLLWEEFCGYLKTIVRGRQFSFQCCCFLADNIMYWHLKNIFFYFITYCICCSYYYWV